MNERKQGKKIGFGTKIPPAPPSSNIFAKKKLKLKRSATGELVQAGDFYDKNIQWLNKKMSKIEKKKAEKKVDELADCKFSPAISMMDIGSKDIAENVDYSGYHNYRADLAPK